MPNIRNLPNKPLVEAIFEMRWGLPDEKLDPNYSLFIGRLYDCVRSEYPYYEPLPASLFMLVLTEGIIQFRFRASKDEWPLIQLGHGIVTVNDSENYTWIDFKKRMKSLVAKVHESYPNPEQLKIESIELKYRDRFELESTDENPLVFLKDKLKSNIVLPEALFENLPISAKPNTFRNTISFPVTNPESTIRLTIGTTTNKKSGKRGLVMEISLLASRSELPKMPDDFEEWAESAHKIADNWFFTLIEGELERKFANE